MAGPVPTLSAPPDAPRADRAGALALLVLGLALALPARAAESPVVFLADPVDPNCDDVSAASPYPDMPQAFPFQPGVPFDVCLRTGVASSTSGVVCQDGSGDEICGFTVFIQAFTTGGAAGGLTVGELKATELVVHYDDQVLNRVGINQLKLLGAGGVWPLLTLTADGSVERIELGSGSGAVAADLIPTDAIAEVPLPEPGATAGLAAGLTLLWALARRRRHGSNRGAPFWVVLTVVAATGAGTSRAGIFTNESAFETVLYNQTGRVAQRIDFESYPTTPPTPPNGSPLSNGEQIRQVTFTSHQGEVAQLEWNGSPLPFGGSFLVRFLDETRGQVAWPGGTSKTDDDLRIDFNPPARAVGLTIVRNANPGGMELIRFLGPKNVEIASAALPSFPAGDGFVGYLAEEVDPPIVAIEIDEGDDPDDMGIDDIRYDAGATPFADAYPPPPPPPPSNDFALHENNGTSIQLAEGGQLTVEFTDNTLSRSGDAQPDLRIWEDPAAPDGPGHISVEISANGLTYYPLGAGTYSGNAEGIVEIDIDPLVPGHQYRYVRITDEGGGVGDPCCGVGIDAVETLSGRMLASDPDHDGVPDEYDNCPGVHNPKQADGNTNGIGDLCERAAIVRLDRDFQTPAPPSPAATLWLEAGSEPISELIVGIWVPPGVTEVRIGDPVSGNECGLPFVSPTGVQDGGPGCASASALNLGKIDEASSGVFWNDDDTDANPITKLPFRDDVVYLVLYGSPILAAPDEVVNLIDIFFIGTHVGVASFDVEYLFATLEKLTLMESGLGTPTRMRMASTSSPPTVDLDLKPGFCDESTGGENPWSLWILPPNSDRMHRVTAGLLGPHGSTDEHLFVFGCDPPSSSCLGEVGEDAQIVAESTSFTDGPYSSTGDSRVPETVYVGVEGGDYSTGVPVFNPNTTYQYCIAEIENKHSDSFAPPISIRDGFTELSALMLYDEDQDEHYQSGASADHPPVAQDAVYEGIDFNSAVESDIDSDKVPNETDNCPYYPNPGQIDLDTTTELGQQCECGDIDRNGSISDSDVMEVRSYLVGAREGSVDIPLLCSVSRSEECDSLDALVLKGEVSSPGQRQARCDAALPD